MKRNNSTAWICLFLALFILPSLLFPLVKGQINTENTENRTLANFPSLSSSDFEDFPAGFEAYYNDRLPFRNQLIRLNNTLQYALFRQQEINGVAIGRDGWLFYCSEEAGNPVEQSLGGWHFTEEQLERIAESMQRTKDVLESQGKEFVLFIAPNKETVYMEKLPAYYERADEYTSTDQLADYLAAHTDVTVVRPEGEILDFKKEHPDIQLYRKLDSHWNNAGAYLGTRALCRALGVELPELTELDMERVQLTEGDLETVMNAAVTDTDTDYTLSGYSSLETVTLKDDAQSECIFETKGADSRRIFVSRDSYSIALAPILSSQFEKAVYVHHSNFTPSQIDEFDADIYILEIVERNIRLIPQYAVN